MTRLKPPGTQGTQRLRRGRPTESAGTQEEEKPEYMSHLSS